MSAAPLGDSPWRQELVKQRGQLDDQSPVSLDERCHLNRHLVSLAREALPELLELLPLLLGVARQASTLAEQSLHARRRFMERQP